MNKDTIVVTVFGFLAVLVLHVIYTNQLNTYIKDNYKPDIVIRYKTNPNICVLKSYEDDVTIQVDCNTNW